MNRIRRVSGGLSLIFLSLGIQASAGWTLWTAPWWGALLTGCLSMAGVACMFPAASDSPDDDSPPVKLGAVYKATPASKGPDETEGT